MSAHIWTFVESVAFILARKAGSVGRMGNIFPSIRNIPKLVPELLELIKILLSTITLIIHSLLQHLSVSCRRGVSEEVLGQGQLMMKEFGWGDLDVEDQAVHEENIVFLLAMNRSN